MQRLGLRHYQGKGISDLYNEYKAGKQNVLFVMATGTGKSRSFSSVCFDMVERGIPVVIVVRRRDLIEQASKNLKQWGIPHGVYMSNHRKYRPSRLVQICSIDTLDARSVYPHSDKIPFIIADEAHDITPKGKKYVKFLNAYPMSKVVGFTATPFSDTSLFDSFVNPIKAHEAMEQGYLTPIKMYQPEGQIDTSQVKVKTNGMFDEKDLFKASSSSKIIGDFVRDWRLYSQGRPTVLFAVNIEHSKMIAQAFNDAGIRAVHADAKTKSNERELMIKKLVRGDIKVLCNVNIFSTGVDIPEASCIQMCRPSQSLIWYLQAVGRGLRPSPETGKTNCILIDNAGNSFRFGSPYKDREIKIGKKEKHDPNEEDVTIRTCKKCHFVFSADQKVCPECNFVNPPVVRDIKQEDGELVEYNMTDEERVQMERGLIAADCMKLKHVAKRTPKIKKKWEWIMYTLKKKYGVDKMELHRDIIMKQLPQGEL